MTANVELRDVEPADLPLFFDHQRDPEAVAMVAFRSRERSAFDEHWAKILANESGLKKTVVVDGQVAGHFLSFIRDEKREIGYWLDRAFWGRGVATRALSAFLQLERSRPLYAGVARHNLASIRVLQKCGFLLSDSAAEKSVGDDDSHVLMMLS